MCTLTGRNLSFSILSGIEHPTLWLEEADDEECVPVILLQQPSMYSHKMQREYIFTPRLHLPKVQMAWGTRKSEQGVNSSPPMTQTDISKTSSDISLMFVSGNYRELNHAIQFDLGCAILRGQRAIWLMCKRYYPLSTSYHSLGALIWRGTGSVLTDVTDRPSRETNVSILTKLWVLWLGPYVVVSLYHDTLVSICIVIR